MPVTVQWFLESTHGLRGLEAAVHFEEHHCPNRKCERTLVDIDRPVCTGCGARAYTCVNGSSLQAATSWFPESWVDVFRPDVQLRFLLDGIFLQEVTIYYIVYKFTHVKLYCLTYV